MLMCYMLLFVFTSLFVVCHADTWNVSCVYACTCAMGRSHFLSDVSLRVTDCASAGLRHFPLNVSRDTESLNLSHNKLRLQQMQQIVKFRNLSELTISNNIIYSLEDLKFRLPNLRYLCLDKNEIGYLPNASFTFLRRLRWLSIADNRIEMMNADAFSGLHDLEMLDLSGNHIYEVAATWFKDLYYLEHLNLENNNIHFLSDEVFRYTKRLRSLNLASNAITSIHDKAFIGLPSLETLNLAKNHIHAIPSRALKYFSHVSVIDFSANHIERITSGAFVQINVTRLILNGVQNLRMIDMDSFKDMRLLEVLEITGNKALRFISPNALSNVPQLRVLKLHNNNLSGIDLDVIKTLSDIDTVSIFANPLMCDCNVRWIIANPGNITLSKGEPHCSSPPALAGISISSLSVTQIKSECPPRILDLFPPISHSILGDSISFECRTFGSPSAHVEWQLPSGDVIRYNGGLVTSSSPSLKTDMNHIFVTKFGGLFIDYVVASDQGLYTCIATNVHGRVEKSVLLNIKNTDVHVVVMRVSATSITVTWSGTRHDYHHLYDLMYKSKLVNNSTYQLVSIRPYMRSFSANRLQPQTSYEFCVAIEHEGKQIIINCTVVTTSKEDVNRGIFNGRNYIIGFGAACAAATFLIICGLGVFIRRYNRKTWQAEALYSDSMSQLFMGTMDTVSDTTPITYENRGAEIFDDDDIAEIRSAAASHAASCSSVIVK